MTPNSLRDASASAARTRPLRTSSATIVSATSSCTCWNFSIPIASVMSEMSPRIASVLAVVRVATWWVMWTTAVVSA